MMAEAVGKATGRPGICFVTGGPDATSASAGIHTAQQDSTPMIMFVGQVTRDIKNRGALQELGSPKSSANSGPRAIHCSRNLIT
jgi:acetolactate synthase I/II/III large subunit